MVDGIFGPKTLSKLAELYEKPVSKLDSEKPQGEVSIVIYALERELIVFSDGKPFKSFPVAVGKFQSPTPIGLYTVIHKDMWGEGFGSRWMQLSVPGEYGIHGTNNPGLSAAMSQADASECIKPCRTSFEWVNIGTKYL